MRTTLHLIWIVFMGALLFLLYAFAMGALVFDWWESTSSSSSF